MSSANEDGRQTPLPMNMVGIRILVGLDCLFETIPSFQKRGFPGPGSSFPLPPSENVPNKDGHDSSPCCAH